jgi:hypothetical protein
MSDPINTGYAKKRSVFDAPVSTIKANGRPGISGDYTTNQTIRSPISAPAPGFVQRVRNMLGSGLAAQGADLVSSRKRVVDKAVEEATK